MTKGMLTCNTGSKGSVHHGQHVRTLYIIPGQEGQHFLAFSSLLPSGFLQLGWGLSLIGSQETRPQTQPEMRLCLPGDSAPSQVDDEGPWQSKPILPLFPSCSAMLPHPKGTHSWGRSRASGTGDDTLHEVAILFPSSLLIAQKDTGLALPHPL